MIEPGPWIAAGSHRTPPQFEQVKFPRGRFAAHNSDHVALPSTASLAEPTCLVDAAHANAAADEPLQRLVHLPRHQRSSQPRRPLRILQDVQPAARSATAGLHWVPAHRDTQTKCRRGGSDRRLPAIAGQPADLHRCSLALAITDSNPQRARRSLQRPPIAAASRTTRHVYRVQHEQHAGQHVRPSKPHLALRPRSARSKQLLATTRIGAGIRIKSPAACSHYCHDRLQSTAQSPSANCAPHCRLTDRLGRCRPHHLGENHHWQLRTPHPGDLSNLSHPKNNNRQSY